MSRFVAWNDLLLTEFFSKASENEDVWFRTARDELDSFGLHLGGAQGLVDAVASGAPWLPGGLDTCADAARMLVRQRLEALSSPSYQDPGGVNPCYAGAKAPAYLPILALWVLAASGQQLEAGFYATVEQLLGRPFRCVPKLTEAMSLAWEDLQAWSTRECAGRFGKFQCRVLGEHRFVGVPRSQCLMSRHDESNIYRLFWEFKLRPGQYLADATIARLLQRGCEAHFLTRALRSAMGQREYAAPLAALLRKLLVGWDGYQPRTGSTDKDGDQRGASGEEHSTPRARASLALAPSDEVVNGWDVRWTLPAMVDAPGCTLQISGQCLPAKLHRANACFLTDLTETTVQKSVAVLSASEKSQVEVDVRFEDAGDGTFGDQSRRELISQTARRILVWDVSDPRFGQQLVEREIPLYGAFYLVCSPTDWTRTEPWLQRERISFEPMQPLGLPEGWRIACIRNAATLSAEHRQHLADDSEAAEVPPARLKLVGGVRLLRGGARIFAAYDLPAIEVESPPGAVLEAPGLRVSEVQQSSPGADRSGIRRYAIEALDGSRSTFDIKVMSNRMELAMLRLRVADPDGEGRGEMRDFSLGPLGLPRPDLDGLRGATLAGARQYSTSQAWRYDEMLEAGTLVEAEEAVADSGAARFLDTLASLGSMSFGAAKDQLSRLSGCTNPISFLMDLRARGCLEIQADARGHLVRIHSAVPTLYGLPAKQDGLPVFGVGGTLRLAHWSALQSNIDFLSFVEKSAEGQLPAFRLAAVDADAVRAACSTMGFQFASCPARDVASWAGSVGQAREAMESGGTESVVAELAHLHRLKPDSARFVPATESRMTIDRESGAQLFRFDDPQAVALQLYVLGVRRADGTSRYSHVHDSRWGVWISQLAFAEMLKNSHGRDDAFPWPVHYDPTTRDVWIPARLRPPAVLERALALCSGRGPEVHLLSPGDRIGDELSLWDHHCGRIVGAASLVYGEFVPGYWLRYSWVPVDTARQVVGLLGCTLRPFASLGVFGGLEAMTV